jgi:hypothetical protein
MDEIGNSASEEMPELTETFENKNNNKIPEEKMAALYATGILNNGIELFSCLLPDLTVYMGNTTGVLKEAGTAYSSQASINVKEYRRGNQKRTIRRNWQHRVHKKKKNKAKNTTQYVLETTMQNKQNKT